MPDNSQGDRPGKPPASQGIYIIGESKAERKRREIQWYGRPIPIPKRAKPPAPTPAQIERRKRHPAYEAMEKALEATYGPLRETPTTNSPTADKPKQYPGLFEDD